MSSEKPNPEKLDRLIEGALKSYSQAEPQAGLEDRVLANLRSAPQSQSWTLAGFGWPQFASAMAAVLVVGVVLYVVYKPSPQKPGQVNEVVERMAPPTKEVASNPKVETPVRSNSRKSTPAVVKQFVAEVRTPAVVPPAPLSDQEKLALRFVRLVETASTKLSAGDARGLTELVIEPLKIEPLNKDDVKDQSQ